jgi:hypothetical protein
MSAWYLDDGVLVGPTDEVRRALDYIASNGPEYGLFINEAKCSLFWPNEKVNNWTDFPAPILRSNDGMVLLGAPIGTRDFCETYATKKIIDPVSKYMKVCLN